MDDFLVKNRAKTQKKRRLAKKFRRTNNPSAEKRGRERPRLDNEIEMKVSKMKKAPIVEVEDIIV